MTKKLDGPLKPYFKGPIGYQHRSGPILVNLSVRKKLEISHVQKYKKNIIKINIKITRK